MKKILFIISTFFFSNISFSQEVGDVLFDNTFLHRIDLDATDLEDLLIWPAYDHQFPVKMTIDGVVVDSIYLRRKGYTSNDYNNTNPPFKIKIDSFISDQKFNGLDIFNLHNHFQDTYYQKNALSYALYKRAGVPAPRTSFTEVYINGNFIDIYTITEDIDKTFLSDNFASKDGSLYKGVEFPPEGVTVNKGDISAFNNYTNNVTSTNWNEYADLHNFFRVIIIDHMIFDDLSGQNDYMYFEPKSEKMHFITWDHNFTYDGSLSLIDTNYILNPKIPFLNTANSSNFINSNTTIKTQYLETACLLTSYLLDSSFIEEVTTHNYNILSSNTNNVIIPQPTGLTSVIAQIKAKYIQSLMQLGYTNCSQIEIPAYINDIVINEFVADSDENGVQEPDGGTPDWIELYNNSNNDIILNDKFYISDDKDFQKKWHFTEEIPLPAGGYLILWADKDIHQTGVHTNFKLKASGEDLIMVYEDMTPLQEINFGQQQLNKGYARIPNGIGPFIIQNHTFSANNELPLSVTENIIKDRVSVYPNPTGGIFEIKHLETNQKGKIIIFNQFGQKVFESALVKTINISSFPSGIYLVRVQFENHFEQIKIIHY